MTKLLEDDISELFDDAMIIALAQSTERPDVAPAPAVKTSLMARLRASSLPPGFVVHLASEDGWRRHPVPGIMMKVLSVNAASGYATFLLDVAPGTRFPPHHHATAEECYVLSGSLQTCGRRLGPGDFVHADAGTGHGELWTEEGCRVLLVAAPEEHMLPA
jgi:anti-sigma factor ChrR (cupin superfamily)